MEKEIELKAKVSDMALIKSKLEKLGCSFSAPADQEDTYFVNFHEDFSIFKTKANFLRIRKVADRFLFTLKQPQSNELDCIQKETEIKDAVQLREAIEIMGYHEVVRVHKTRITANYKDMEICLDEVKDLGAFIELERITDRNANEVQNELFGFLESLGISKKDKIVNGYDTLVYLKSRS